MTFSENTNLLPGGQSASPAKVKELENRIDDLQQTVTSVADSVADLSDTVTTSELNATIASISNATVDNATVGSETVTTLSATTASADNLSATDANLTNVTADEIDANTVDVTNGYFNSVNAQSFTGQGVNITGDITASNKVQGKNIVAETKVTTPALESTETELKGTTTARGDVYFPENGDKIYGEYLEVDADKIKVKSLTTETSISTNDLVGFDANGNLIPVDASTDPASLWQNKSGDITTIVPKNNKKVEATNGATVDGTLQVNGDIIQNGSAYETHAEKLYTKKDIIITRDGAVSALSAGDFTGIQAKKYDGTNDGQLVFDNTGEARVGDVGDTEPLLTRDEASNLTNGAPLVWDSTNKRAVSGTVVDTVVSGNMNPVTSNAVANVLAKYPNTEYYNTLQTQALNCNNIEDRVALVTANFSGYENLNYPAKELMFIFTTKNSSGDGMQKAISWTAEREWNRILKNNEWAEWYELATTDAVNTALTNTMLKVVSYQGEHTFTQVDTWETVASLTLGDGQYLIMFNMFWDYSKPIALKIEYASNTVTNDDNEEQIAVTAFVESGSRKRQFALKAKGSDARANSYSYIVYKVS